MAHSYSSEVYWLALKRKQWNSAITQHKESIKLMLIFAATMLGGAVLVRYGFSVDSEKKIHVIAELVRAAERSNPEIPGP